MECFDDEHTNYWETNMFLQTQELDSYFDEAISAYYDSSSPDGMQSSMASKNIVSERNRRKMLNERLYALRSVVPNITKMDKASIIKDAIGYIQSLNDEVGRIQSQISELESNGGMSSSNNANFGHFDQEATTTYCSNPKRSRSFISSPIEVLEIRVFSMGEKTIVVSLTCDKRRDTMVKLCEIFEPLKLKIIMANITSFSGRILKTLFLEGNEEEKEVLRVKIEAAIAAHNLDNYI